MTSDQLAQKAEIYLQKFCTEIQTRRLGTEGNRESTHYFKAVMDNLSFETEQQSFDCMAMLQGDIELTANNMSFKAYISPHSVGCNIKAELAIAINLEQLKSINAEGKILMLSGEIAKEQLMPKGFIFYNPEEHQEIYRLLEEKKPAAVITATTKNPDAVGAIYPFPMIEDGDFNIPTAYMSAEEGHKLASHSGNQIELIMESVRLEAKGENIVARKGSMDKRVVVCAHIDTKENTPGALDNASGVSILLLLAELLEDYQGRLGIELAALNGEEYYNTPGQNTYLKLAVGTYESILLAINLDDIGYYKDRSAYSLYEVPDAIADSVRRVYAKREGFFEGPAWYQSDHGIFIANGIPAMAITEESFLELLSEITHSEKDTPEIVDPNKLVENAQGLFDLIMELDKSQAN